MWLYLLAAGWTRIGQEEHLVGRAGSRGDELGARLIAARLVRDAMQLGFLMERTYAPYAKWFGTAFGRLDCAGALVPALGSVLDAPEWRARDAALAEVYRQLATRHAQLGVTDPIESEPGPFHGRPFTVIWGERFAGALVARIEDPRVRSLASRPPVGGVDQFSDSTDLRAPEWRAGLRRLLGDAAGAPGQLGV